MRSLFFTFLILLTATFSFGQIPFCDSIRTDISPVIEKQYKDLNQDGEKDYFIITLNKRLPNISYYIESRIYWGPTFKTSSLLEGYSSNPFEPLTEIGNFDQDTNYEIRLHDQTLLEIANYGWINNPTESSTPPGKHIGKDGNSIHWYLNTVYEASSSNFLATIYRDSAALITTTNSLPINHTQLQPTTQSISIPQEKKFFQQCFLNYDSIPDFVRLVFSFNHPSGITNGYYPMVYTSNEDGSYTTNCMDFWTNKTAYDFNNDGLSDFYSENSNLITINDGFLTFHSIHLASNILKLIDFNDDGFMDFIGTDGNIYLSTNGNQFTNHLRLIGFPDLNNLLFDLTGDLNNDGYKDLLCSSSPTNQHSNDSALYVIWGNNNDYNFLDKKPFLTETSQIPGEPLSTWVFLETSGNSIEDFNQDGQTDLYYTFLGDPFEGTVLRSGFIANKHPYVTYHQQNVYHDTLYTCNTSVSLQLMNAGLYTVWSTGDTTSEITLDTTSQNSWVYYQTTNSFNQTWQDSIYIVYEITPGITSNTDTLYNTFPKKNLFDYTGHLEVSFSGTFVTGNYFYPLLADSGLHTIYIHTPCDTSYTDSILIYVKPLLTSITTPTIKKSFLLFPNPASNMLFLQASTGNEVTEYSIYTISGILVKSGTLVSSITDISISDLSTGLYFIEVKNQHVKKNFKFVKN